MKKIRNVLLSMAMIFIVVLSTACSSKEAATATKTYVLEKNGLKTTIVYTYIEKEDKVVKQTTKNEGIYAQLPSTKTKEEAQKVLDPIAKKYQGIKGIKHSIDYQEDKFIEDLEVDYTNIDYEKAKEVLGKNLQDPAKTKISMKKTEELMNKMGYTEQK